MNGPVPVRPQEPRWYLSVNGTVEGPYGQAYIVACLNAGQIPSGALLCLEGTTQWQPLNAWPQFTGTHPPPPPSSPFAFSVGECAPRISTGTRTVLPDRMQSAITYVRFWSPMVWGLTAFLTFSALQDLENFLALLVFLVMESAGRGVMLLGANQVNDHSRSGATTMLVGSWVLAGALALRLSLVFGAVLVVLSLEPAASEMGFEEPGQAATNVSELVGVVLVLAFLVEFGYLFFFRSAVSHFQRTRR